MGCRPGRSTRCSARASRCWRGVDLDTGYLFGLSLSATRDAGAWAQVLREGQGQGLSLSVVVKDAAKGIAAGVAEVFPHAEQRDDCFHVLYEMNKVRRKLERRAYAAIEREGEALGRLGKIRARDKTCRRKAKCALRKARRQCPEAIERFDAFEAAMDTLRGALECVDVASGELHRPEQVEALIAQAAGRIESLGTGECAKLARYLRNRAPGLVLAQHSVLPRLEALGEQCSMPAVRLGCLCWYLVRALGKRPSHAPQAGAVSSSARRLCGAVRPARPRERVAARCRRGGAAPAPPCIERHRGVQCGTAPLSLRPQGRHPRLSRPVPRLVQSAHPAVGATQGDQRPPEPDRTAGPRLAHAARLPALASARIARGRWRALTSLDTPTPSTACLGTVPLACVKMNPLILIGADRFPFATSR